jgi:hypothetical protein
MESTYIKRRSLEEIRTEDEIHLLSAKLDQTREDIRSLSSKLGTWEELKQLSEDIKRRESELEIRVELTNQLQCVMEEKLKNMEEKLMDRIESMESSSSTNVREMGERLCFALDQFTAEVSQPDPEKYLMSEHDYQTRPASELPRFKVVCGDDGTLALERDETYAVYSISSKRVEGIIEKTRRAAQIARKIQMGGVTGSDAATLALDSNELHQFCEGLLTDGSCSDSDDYPRHIEGIVRKCFKKLSMESDIHIIECRNAYPSISVCITCCPQTYESTTIFISQHIKPVFEAVGVDIEFSVKVPDLIEDTFLDEMDTAVFVTQPLENEFQDQSQDQSQDTPQDESHDQSQDTPQDESHDQSQEHESHDTPRDESHDQSHEQESHDTPQDESQDQSQDTPSR